MKPTRTPKPKEAGRGSTAELQHWLRFRNHRMEFLELRCQLVLEEQGQRRHGNDTGVKTVACCR